MISTTGAANAQSKVLACIALVGLSALCAFATPGLASTSVHRAQSDPPRYVIYTERNAGEFSASYVQNILLDTATNTRTDLLPEGCAGPIFSPNGNRALVGCFNASYLDGLYIFYPSTRTPLRLATGLIGAPTFSPDGKAVVYAKSADGAGAAEHLFHIPAGGGKATQLTFGSASDDDPSFSPDGHWILFDRTNAAVTETDIYAMPAQGGAPHLVGISPHGVGESTGGVSPDGSLLLWRDRLELHAAGFDGATAMVTDSPPDHVLVQNVTGGSGSWSPDGSQIGYGSQRIPNGGFQPTPHATIANANGTDARVVSNDPEGYASTVAAWLPTASIHAWKRNPVYGNVATSLVVHINYRGRSVPGLRVRATTQGPNPNSRLPVPMTIVRSATTDEHGTARIGGIKPGTWQLFVHGIVNGRLFDENVDNHVVVVSETTPTKVTAKIYQY